MLTRQVVEAIARKPGGRELLAALSGAIGELLVKADRLKRRREVVCEVSDWPSEPERGRMNWQ